MTTVFHKDSDQVCLYLKSTKTIDKLRFFIAGKGWPFGSKSTVIYQCKDSDGKAYKVYENSIRLDSVYRILMAFISKPYTRSISEELIRRLEKR